MAQCVHSTWMSSIHCKSPLDYLFLMQCKCCVNDYMTLFRKWWQNSKSYTCWVQMWIFSKTEYEDLEHIGMENQLYCLRKNISNLLHFCLSMGIDCYLPLHRLWGLSYLYSSKYQIFLIVLPLLERHLFLFQKIIYFFQSLQTVVFVHFIARCSPSSIDKIDHCFIPLWLTLRLDHVIKNSILVMGHFFHEIC